MDRWLDLADDEKMDLLDEIESMVDDFALHKSNAMTGIDGKWLNEQYLAADALNVSYDPRCLRAACQGIGGIDCSEFVLFPAT